MKQTDLKAIEERIEGKMDLPSRLPLELIKVCSCTINKILLVKAALMK